MEFSAYGVFAPLVQSMVNLDVPENVITYFYTHLATDTIGVEYIYHFHDAVEYLVLQESIIIATVIPLCHRQTGRLLSHAVCFVKDGDDVYFFDPNGYDTEFTYGYVYEGACVTIVDLAEELAVDYGLTLNYQSSKGVQYYGPNDSQSTFINQGGYCMFYLYCFIDHLCANWEKSTMIDYLVEKIHIDYQESNGIFPSRTALPYYSLGVIWGLIPSFFTSSIPAPISP